MTDTERTDLHDAGELWQCPFCGDEQHQDEVGDQCAQCGAAL